MFLWYQQLPGMSYHKRKHILPKKNKKTKQTSWNDSNRQNKSFVNKHYPFHLWTSISGSDEKYPGYSTNFSIVAVWPTLVHAKRKDREGFVHAHAGSNPTP